MSEDNVIKDGATKDDVAKEKTKKERKVKCPECGKQNYKKDTVVRNKRYLCIPCNEAIESRKSSWSKLFDYICELYKIEKPNTWMLKQINDFKRDYEFTDEGMYYTLKHYYETLGKTVKENTGLGIIPYYYDRTRQKFDELYKNIEYMAEFEVTESIQTIGIKDVNKKRKKSKQLSLETVKWEEENDC